MAENRNACEKCLLREMSDSEYFTYLERFLKALTPKERVSDALYEERLAACKTCDYLQNAACRHCGCFVEMRAAVKDKHCPAVAPKW